MMIRQFAAAFLTLSSALLACPAMAQESPLDQAIKMIRQSGDETQLPPMLYASATQHLQAGRLDRATEQIDESIDLAIKYKDESNFKAILMTAGNLLVKLRGEPSKAFFAGVLKRVEDSPKMKVMVLETLGERLLQSGDIVAAIALFHDAFEEISQTDPESEAAFWTTFQYGQACVNGKLFDIGMPAMKRAKEIALKLGRPELASYTNAPIGNACLITEEYDVGESIYRSQLAMAKESQDESAIDQAVYGLATILIRQEKLDEAESLLKEALLRNRGSGRGVMRSMMQSPLALVNLARGQTDEATRLQQMAVDSKSADIPFAIRLMMGKQATMMDHAALASFHYLAGNRPATRKAIRNSFSGYRSAASQAEKLADQGMVNLDAMLTAYSELPSSLSSVQQLVLVDEGKPEDALVESEKGRALAQLDAMRKNFGGGNEAGKETVTIEQIKEIAAQENVTFVEYSVIHPLDFYSRNILGKAYPIANPSELFIWVIKPDQTIHFRRVKLDARLTDLVEAARLIVNPPREETSETDNTDSDPKDESDRQTGGDVGPEEPQPNAIAKLAEWVIKPIETLLPANPDDEVAIIPHGQLFAVPFAALPTADGQPLIASHTLVHAASIGAYKLSVSRRGAAGNFKFKDILIVGNPEMPMYQYRPDKPASPLDPLPGAEREAKAIGKMLGIEPLIGQLAKESEVRKRMKIAPVIHLASHGILQAENALNQPYLSAIALSPDETDNGFLTVSEIMRMKLAADLAVLSACDSGRGKITGDGVVGLSRGYLAAGVPTVVVSLWPVSDAATAYLMVTFYDAMRNGKSKAAALRDAMLLTRQKFESPNLWAPFSIYGAGH